MYLAISLMAGLLSARRLRLLVWFFRAAARAWSCCKRLTAPPLRFSLLAMGRVTGELQTSMDDVTMDKDRSRVIRKDAKGNMIDKYSDLRMIPDLGGLYILA